MRLASLKAGGRDGTLIVVDRALKRAVAVPDVAVTLQHALENWRRVHPELDAAYQALNAGDTRGFDLDFAALAAPLPRAYQWLDGSSYLTHIERARKARGVEMPPGLMSDPLMYQGLSDGFLGPRDPIRASEEWGVDFESEVAVITDDVPMGVAPEQAGAHIKLIMLVNDVSLRNLIPAELAKGFGFVHGKPASAFSPVAVTPDELGDAWDGAKVHLPLLTHLNGKSFGHPNAGRDIQFDFPTLISHASKTRALGAGTIIGSGTVSNADRTTGCSCIIEQRAFELIDSGKATTPFLHYGDRVHIDMLDASGKTIFGAIEQVVEPYST
jgi:fumarylacetoacetate (FAA) hydrolase